MLNVEKAQKVFAVITFLQILLVSMAAGAIVILEMGFSVVSVILAVVAAVVSYIVQKVLQPKK